MKEERDHEYARPDREYHGNASQAKSISLAESEAREDELRNRLRQQLKATEKLCHFLDDADDAAAQLRSSARWQIANPVAALKANFLPRSPERC